MLKQLIVLFSLVLIVGCGKTGPAGPQGVQGATGETGAPGTDGEDGQDGASCTVQKVDPSEDAPNGGARVICGDSDVLLLNGAPGEDGEDGEKGTGLTIIINCKNSHNKHCE